MPTIKELQTLVDYERFNPAVSPEFDGAACGLGCIDLSDPSCSCTLMDGYWSSTQLNADLQRALGVKFNLGLVAHQPKHARAAVRAVRDAVLQSFPARGQEELDGAATKLSSSQGSS